MFDNVKDFADSIARSLNEDPKKPENRTFIVQQVTKNNNSVFTAITFKDENSPAGTTVPLIYCEDFYEHHKSDVSNGWVPEDISYLEAVNSIKNAIETHSNFKLPGFSTDDIGNIDVIKDRIQPKLVNLENNTEYLADKPYKQIDDLAVMYRICLDDEASIPINNSMLTNWGIDRDELDSIAYGNLGENEFSFKTMSETLGEMMVPGFTEMSEEEKKDIIDNMFPDTGMYIITNNTKLFGAINITHAPFMERVRNQIGDFVIIPSSIHECIVIKKEMIDNARGSLENMICEVNANEVKSEEVLSTHPYEFDFEAGTLITYDENKELGEDLD